MTTSLSGSSSIGPLKSHISTSSRRGSNNPIPPPTPYLDVMSVRTNHVPRDGIEETRTLVYDPVLIPDLEHTGVRPSVDLEDRFLFYPSGCKNCNLYLNITNTLRNASQLDGDKGAQGTGEEGRIGTGIHVQGCGRAAVRFKVQKQPPNKVMLAPCSPSNSAPLSVAHSTSVGTGLRSGGASLSSQTDKQPGSALAPASAPKGHAYVMHGLMPAGKSPPRLEGRYNLNGVKTLRRKPTSDKEAKELVKSLQSTAHQMSLLVFTDV